MCIGEVAEVEQACDLVRGPQIIFHLGSERLKVEGAADVRIARRHRAAAATAAGGGPGR